VARRAPLRPQCLGNLERREKARAAFAFANPPRLPARLEPTRCGCVWRRGGVEVASSSLNCYLHTPFVCEDPISWLGLLSRCLGSRMPACLGSAQADNLDLTFSVNSSRLDPIGSGFAVGRPILKLVKRTYVDVWLCSELRQEQPTRGRGRNTFCERSWTAWTVLSAPESILRLLQRLNLSVGRGPRLNRDSLHVLW
jgi:hypothetical protein